MNFRWAPYFSGLALGVVALPLLCVFNTLILAYALARHQNFAIAPAQTWAALPVDFFLAAPVGLLLGSVCDAILGLLKAHKTAAARRLCWLGGLIGTPLFACFFVGLWTPSRPVHNLFHDLYCYVLVATCCVWSLSLLLWGAALRKDEG